MDMPFLIVTAVLNHCLPQNGASPLFTAATNNQPLLAKYLMDKGASSENAVSV